MRKYKTIEYYLYIMNKFDYMNTVTKLRKLMIITIKV